MLWNWSPCPRHYLGWFINLWEILFSFNIYKCTLFHVCLIVILNGKNNNNYPFVLCGKLLSLRWYEYLRVILLKKIQFACFFQILSLFVLEIQQKVEVFDKYCTYLIACVCSFNYALAHAIIVLLFKRWYHFICRICIW